MRKNINLKKLVEQKVDEAWYNNLDDFYHSVGKAATIGTLGAATLGGCAYCADKGLENNYQYQQNVNKQAAEMSKGGQKDYEEWCEIHHMNPHDSFSMDQYEEWNQTDDGGEMNESRLNNVINRAIKKAFNEARECKGGFCKDGHKAYNQRMRNIDTIVRSTMKDIARLVSERMQQCASSLYQEGVADAEQIAYQWEREIRNAIFSQNLQKKFFQA